MSNLSYEILERRQKMHIKSYALLCMIILLAMGFYSYKKWDEYSLARKGIIENEKYIAVLTEKTSEEKAVYEKQKPTFIQLDKTIEKNLKTIFPESDDYTTLTRQLDDYEGKLSKKNNIFEVSNIEYQSPVESENYSILPFRMTIRSSRENFNKFLHLIENSGAIDSDLRVMDIISIRINFEESEDETLKNSTLNFAVQINAYFQKSA